MLAAASMGSTAFQKGLGAIHSLSHPVNANLMFIMVYRMQYLCLMF